MLVNVQNPTTTTYRNQINSMRNTIDNKCNSLWSIISEAHSFTSKFTKSFEVHHTTLPTMYTQIKTHKIDPEINPSDLDIHDFKTRPIVSCCGSPTEKLAWIISHIIKPLLQHVPCHLFNIHSHLETTLRSIPPEELVGLKIYSADIAALYTNLSIEQCINDIIAMSEEYWNELDTFGITLSELHQLLEVVFYNSYFTFNQKLYQQCVGLFMGCSPSPAAAVIRVYTFEKNSIYIHSFYLSGIWMIICQRHLIWSTHKRLLA